MRSEILGDIKITPSEVKNFYKKTPIDSLPLIDGQVEYYQILKFPPYSEDAILEVRERLLNLRERILNGEKFSKLAALYSEGPSAPMGGEIGFMAKAELDRLVALAKKEFKKKPDVPTEEDTAEARRKRVEELRRRKGRGASILTGGSGLTSEASLGRTSLLGAS